MKEHWTVALIEMKACHEAVQWAQEYPTAQAAWDACRRPDWMFWLLEHTQPATEATHPHHAYVRIACAEARLGLPYTTDLRVEACISTVEGWESCNYFSTKKIFENKKLREEICVNM